MIATFDFADGIGTLDLDDGRQATFSQRSWDGFAKHRPREGMRVVVLRLEEGFRGRLRAVSLEPDSNPQEVAAPLSSARWALLDAHEVDPSWVQLPGPGSELTFVLGDDGGLVETLREWAPVPRDSLETWAVEEQALRDQATSNLTSLGPWEVSELRPGTHALCSSDGYAAARLLAWADADLPWVSGQPVVFAPHRDMLYLTGTDDPEGISIAARLSESVLLEGRPERVKYRVVGADGRLPDPLMVPDPGGLTGRPLVWAGGRWFPFEASAGEAALALEVLRDVSHAATYNRQKARLDAEFEASGEDIFVASVMRRFTNDGPEYMTSWTEDVDTLLPAAPKIGIVTAAQLDGLDDTVPVSAPWEKAVAEFELQRTNHSPPRWRTGAFPTEQQRAKFDPW